MYTQVSRDVCVAMIKMCSLCKNSVWSDLLPVPVVKLVKTASSVAAVNLLKLRLLPSDLQRI